MNSHRIPMLVAAALLSSACMTTTPYQPLKGGEGYSEQRIESNRYTVRFFGNAQTPRQTVENYLLYRAAELSALCSQMAPLTKTPAGTTVLPPGGVASMAAWIAAVFTVVPSPPAPKEVTSTTVGTAVVDAWTGTLSRDSTPFASTARTVNPWRVLGARLVAVNFELAANCVTLMLS